MLFIIVSLCFIALILKCNDLLWQRKIIKGEVSRKTAHIAIGSFIAIWPLYMTWQEMRIAITIALICAVFVRVYRIFPSIFDVQRRSIGDIAAPLIIALAIFIEPTKTIFAVVVLHVAFADGMAALVGCWLGKNNTYRILGQTKSLAGTAAFYVSSLIIMATAGMFQTTFMLREAIIFLGVIPIVTTAIENISPRGLDNIFVPAAVILLLIPM
jgi:phytol kinase